MREQLRQKIKKATRISLEKGCGVSFEENLKPIEKIPPGATHFIPARDRKKRIEVFFNEGNSYLVVESFYAQLIDSSNKKLVSFRAMSEGVVYREKRSPLTKGAIFKMRLQHATRLEQNPKYPF